MVYGMRKKLIYSIDPPLDEAPIMYRYWFETIDITLWDIVWFKNILGSKLQFEDVMIVFEGDKYCPSYPKKISKKWWMQVSILLLFERGVLVLKLTKNMRLLSMNSESEATELTKIT